MKRLFTILIISFVALCHLKAQTSLDLSNISSPSCIAPAFFGPNAFPVPEMSDGTTSSRLKLELYSDHFFGTTTSAADDYTTDIFARLTIPLFSPRANLVIWGPLYEFFHTGAEVNSYRRLPHLGDVDYHSPGDFYVSTDFQPLIQDRHHLDMTIRAALKSASGDRYEYARYYDSPGYFFDASFARGFTFGNGNYNLRVALSGGFLCWQTDNGRQNDAVMYGALLAFTLGDLMLKTQYGGYVGWEQYGDSPMTIRADLSWAIGDLSLNLGYQYGFNDWPFHQVRMGLSYSFLI